ncbi:tripartite tricarboxylate transporter permease [Pseudorhodoplanes sp.]|uniref:tripartite tricarboxylate transporter permease n=1 Tax=Pseudorhodoplanes sp. TaxID=1934341 RepID=UPI003D0E28AA
MDLLNGLMLVMTPEYLAYSFVGCLLGTLVGVLPGVGAASAVAILFPFTTFLPPAGMIITMASIYYGAQYGGSTTAILVNVPGEVSSMVTAVDGYEMTKQGKAGPALAMAAIASFLAGIVGALMVALIGPSVARLALFFGPAEYLGLGLFSLTAIAALAGSSLLRAVLVALFGMLLSSVGFDDSSGLPRLTFGVTPLLQGFDLVPVMIGLFGVGEVLSSLREEGTLITNKIGKLMPNREEMRAGLAAASRATGISLILGLLPGMMPSIGSFLSYSIERYQSRTPQRFGRGAIEGVASSEAANNATAMANLIPLLGLGIPTGPTMALMLAAFTLYGIVPGPLLFTQQATLVWTLIGSFFIGNIILLILNLPLVGLWVRLSTIPYPIMAPIILAICMVGAYSTRNSMFDVWICVLFGALGWTMRVRGWPLAPLVLAFVLGPMIERAARQVIAVSPDLLLHRPAFWLFIALGILVIWASHRFAVRGELTD